MSANFLANYIVGNAVPGAPTMNLNLNVDPKNLHETGKADITQTTQPPLKLHADIEGKYTNLNNEVFMTLIAKDDKFGATLALPKFGEAGEASFWYRDKDRIVQIGPVPAVPKAA